MVSIDDNKVFIINGSGSKKITCLNIKFEDYEDYLNITYITKYSFLCLVNNKFLYIYGLL